MKYMEEIKPLILASRSPRRKDLLSLLGIPFQVVPSSFEDSSVTDVAPHEMVVRYALEKTLDVATRNKNSWVLGADTVVVHKGRVLGKPENREEALHMLLSLSGHTHCVFTGVCLYHVASGYKQTCHEVTEVSFREFSTQEASAYVRTGEPLDKAGAYGAQGRGSALINNVRGSYTSVVGLPLSKVVEMLTSAGILEISADNGGMYRLTRVKGRQDG